MVYIVHTVLCMVMGLDLTWKKSAHEMLDHKCVCLLVDLADLCTVSHANFVFVMMQYLDCR